MKKNKSFTNKSNGKLEIINKNVAGVDLGSKEHWICVPSDRCEKNIRTFNVYTSDVKKMGNWLIKCGISTVVVESTGTYWIPVFNILEPMGLELMLVNAKDVKNAPGRKKTDRIDCAWLQKLGMHGMITPSFIPPSKTRALNCLITQRDNLVKNSSSFIQRMQKSLIEMNIFLHNVISDITGKTGMKILEAIVNGESNPEKLAKYRDPRIKCSKEEIMESLKGYYKAEHLYVLRQNLELYGNLQDKVSQCEDEISQLLDTFESKIKDVDSSGNKPVDLFHRIIGADCSQIPGLSKTTLTQIISKTGCEVTPWKTSNHFASWLGLSPNNHITGGKIIRSKSKKVKNAAAEAFRQAAATLSRSKSYLGAFKRRLTARFGPKKANAITARKIAVIFYNMVKNCTEYKELGGEYYNEKYKERYLNSLKRKAIQAGFVLQPISK